MAHVKSTEVIHMRLPTAYIARAIMFQTRMGHIPQNKTEAVKRCFFERLIQLGGEDALDEAVSAELKQVLRPYMKGSYSGVGFNPSQIKDLKQAHKIQMKAEALLARENVPEAIVEDIPENAVDMALIGVSKSVVDMVEDMRNDGIDEEILLEAAGAPTAMAEIYLSLATTLEPSEAYNAAIDEYQATKKVK